MTADRGALPPSALHVNALPVGTKLGEFEILGLVGEGGFGIVYLAYDHSLDRKVAIKEYMPALLASRGENASVSVRSERQRETFGLGLRSFVNEAKLLARFEHPALIKVYRFWEGNGTAYMAMPYLTGQTLEDALKARGAPPDEAWIRSLLGPLMEALAVLHDDRIYHRDIAPDNIMLLAGDRPVLLDFGAARRVITDTTQGLTVILKPGYAPIEQYADRAGMKQGPWTDVYALAAVVHFMILGKKPPPAVSRLMEDGYEPLAKSEAAGRYSARLLEGIDRCLALKPQDRPQSMAAMREAIGGAATAPAPEPARAPVREEPTLIMQSPARKVALADEPDERTIVKPPPPVQGEAAPPPRPPSTGNALPLRAAGGVLALVVVVAGGAWYAMHRTPAAAPASTASVASAPSTRAAAASTASIAAAPPPATDPVPPPAPRIETVASAIDAAVAAADPRLSLTLHAPPSVPLGDELKVSAQGGADGTLYVFAWDQPAGKVHRLMLDDKAGATAVKANESVSLTYKDAATRAATEPPGNWRLVSMLSEKPRDFSGSAFGRDGGHPVVERSAIEAQLAAHGLSALFGIVPCDVGASCKDSYAISVADVARPAASSAPPERAARAKAGQRSAASDAAPRGSKQSEREYMKRFNKDLDSLLGK